MSADQTLEGVLPQVGTLTWIGLRPARGVPMTCVESATVVAGRGLDGDRYGGSGKRAVTLINAEHLPAIGSFMGEGPVEPARLRRNLVVSGINLHALTNRTFRIGEVVLQWTDLCDPCKRMEAELGEGGYNAMRQHGGITARVITGGTIRVGDPVSAVEA